VQEKIKQITHRMPESLHKRIGHEAVERGLNVTRCINVLLEEALAACRDPVPKDQNAPKEP
jgi:predicted DNA binding CopG/RHH family protein